MAQDILTPQDYAGSVVAVPPIALDRNGRVAVDANRKIMKHIAEGGVQTLLYGGNANLYHFSTAQYREALDVLFGNCPDTARILFSMGPDFGKAQDQADAIHAAGVKNVMLLPMAFPSDARGVAEGVRRLADKLGFGLVLYLKRDAYVAPEDLQRLLDEGAVSFVKYAVERDTPEHDAYLDAVLAVAGRDRVASGMGETPIHNHIGQRKLVTYTSGAVCIAPAAANELLHLYRSGRLDEAQALSQPFLEFERQRMRFGGITLLHDAITLSGLADCGPMLPMLSNLDEVGRAAITPTVQAIMAAEQAASHRRMAA